MTVELSKNGQVQQSVNVVPGANSTRITAGQYDVSLAAGSDQFTIDRETIEIKRGQTVIARIRSVSPNGSNSAVNTNISNAGAAATTPFKEPTDEPDNVPVYDGKTLATWRNELTRERSFDAISSALKAIDALADPEDRPKLVQEFLFSFPSHLTDEELIKVLIGILTISRDNDTYLASIVAALPKLNDQDALRLITVYLNPISQSRPPSIANRYDPALYAPLAQWAAVLLWQESNRQNSPSAARSKLIEAAALEIVMYITSLSVKPGQRELERKYLEALTSCKLLDDNFWAQMSPQKDQPFSVLLAIEIESRATNRLLTSQNPAELATAALQLTRLLDTSYDRTEMPPFAKRGEVIEAIRKHLVTYIEDPRKMRALVEIRSSTLEDFSHMTVSPRLGRFLVNVQYSFLTHPCLDMLRLAQVLDGNEALQAELSQLLELVKEPAINFAVKHGFNNAASLNQTSISWPDLSIAMRTAFGDRQAGKSQPAEDAITVFVFSMVEGMLPIEKQVALSREIPEAIKEGWIKKRLKEWDLNEDGKVDANEGFNSRLDTDGDQVLTRKELQSYFENTYNQVFRRVPGASPTR